MVARVRAPLDRARLGRRRLLLLAAARLEGRLERGRGRVGRGRARRALRPRRDHGGRISRAAPRPEGPAVVRSSAQTRPIRSYIGWRTSITQEGVMTARKLVSFPNPVNELSARLVAGG